MNDLYYFILKKKKKKKKKKQKKKKRTWSSERSYERNLQNLTTIQSNKLRFYKVF